jgi:hypothetical protein
MVFINIFVDSVAIKVTPLSDRPFGFKSVGARQPIVFTGKAASVLHQNFRRSLACLVSRTRRPRQHQKAPVKS